MQKKVQIITNCSCTSCMETSKIKPDYNTLLQSLTEENLDKNVNVAHETPDLLLDPNLNASKNTTRDGAQVNELLQLVKKLKDSQKLDESEKELFNKFEEKADLEKLREMFKKNSQEDKEEQHEHHHQHQHEHQHQHQQQQQHLHHGPHHSLVLDSDVKEKIDVEPHYLHPAVAGQEISYHDNILMGKEKKKDF